MSHMERLIDDPFRSILKENYLKLQHSEAIVTDILSAVVKLPGKNVIGRKERMYTGHEPRYHLT